MNRSVLSSQQVDEFITRGFVRLAGAFSEDAARMARKFLWQKLAAYDVKPDDPTTWTQPMIHVREVYSSSEFEACSTLRLKDGVEDLVGRGRWIARDDVGGWGDPRGGWIPLHRGPLSRPVSGWDRSPGGDPCLYCGPSVDRRSDRSTPRSPALQ